MLETNMFSFDASDSLVDENSLGFGKKFRNRVSNAARNYTVAGQASKLFRRRFDGEEEEELGFLKKVFKKKEGGTKLGNLLRTGAQIGKSIAGAAIPGVGTLISKLPIGEGLMMKKAAQDNPVGAVQGAQTLPEAAVVAKTIAPNASADKQREIAISIQAANTPAAAAAVTQAAKEADNKSKMLKIGGIVGGVLGFILIVWLIVRK